MKVERFQCLGTRIQELINLSPSLSTMEHRKRRLAILPVSGIPPSLAPIKDRSNYRVLTRRQKDVGRHKIIMRENHGHFPIDLDIASILKLLNGVCTVKWASQFLVAGEKDVM